jgi:hypothetical protein
MLKNWSLGKPQFCVRTYDRARILSLVTEIIQHSSSCEDDPIGVD